MVKWTRWLFPVLIAFAKSERLFVVKDFLLTGGIFGRALSNPAAVSRQPKRLVRLSGHQTSNEASGLTTLELLRTLAQSDSIALRSFVCLSVAKQAELPDARVSRSPDSQSIIVLSPEHRPPPCPLAALAAFTAPFPRPS